MSKILVSVSLLFGLSLFNSGRSLASGIVLLTQGTLDAARPDDVSSTDFIVGIVITTTNKMSQSANRVIMVGVVLQTKQTLKYEKSIAAG